MALEKFAAAMESLLTPRANQWHDLKATDEALNDIPEVKEWFEEVTRVLFAIRNSPDANFYSQKHEGYKSLGAFGSDCLFVEDLDASERRPRGGVKYTHCNIGKVWIGTDHQGRIDTTYRTWKMSAKAAEQQWGDQLPSMIRRALEERPWDKFEFLHCVMPNPDRVLGRLGPVGMEFISMYLGLLDKEMIEEGGFHENPYIYSRYTVNPTEIYGRSPAMLVLPSIKMAQEMQKTFIRSGHKLVDPPLLLHNDGVLGTGSRRVRLKPGGLNWGGVDNQGRQMIQPLVTGGRLDLTEGMLEKEREVINDAFLVTLFQILVDQPQMTATEALLRAQEKGQLLAPTVGRQQSEMLGPMIEREIGILLRQGQLPPAPEVLLEAEGEYEIEYQSDATRFQRSSSLVGADRTVERAVAIAQLDPSAFAVINGEEYIRLSSDVEGAPTKLLRTPEEMEQIQQEAQQRATEREALEQAEMAARAAKDVGAAEAAGPGTVPGPTGAPVGVPVPGAP